MNACISVGAVDARRKARKLAEASRWQEAVQLADRGGCASNELLAQAAKGIAHQLVQVLSTCTLAIKSATTSHAHQLQQQV